MNANEMSEAMENLRFIGREEALKLAARLCSLVIGSAWEHEERDRVALDLSRLLDALGYGANDDER